jgi:hypothetical protein
VTHPLAIDLARALDPVALASKIGMEPDPWQEQVMRSTSSRLLLNCCRQSGKSTTASVVAVHCALYEPGALILLVSPGLRQSQELFRKCLVVYRTLGRPVAASAENALTLELENGSRIVSLPGTEATVRSFSAVRLLIVDEASRVADDLYVAVRPMLAVSGGRLIAMSTPFGRRGFFYEAWEHEASWEKVKIAAQQVPRISAQFLEEERRSLGDWFFKQEYLGEFVDSVEQLFTAVQIDSLMDASIAPLFGGAHA